MNNTRDEDVEQKDESEDVQFLKPSLPINTTSVKTNVSEAGSDHIPSKNQQQEIELRYSEPIWARVPTSSKDDYHLEVIKDGSIIDNINLHVEDKSYFAIGRFDPCEIKLEHPSVSRFHAILQYGECTRGKPQWFIFDLNSTHGVRVNKNPIKKNTFVPLSSGHVFQIAGSSRIFVLSGGLEPEEDKQKTPTKESIATENKKLEENKTEENKNDDQKEEEEKQRYYQKDPIYWLEKYFEREGTPLDFKFTQTSEGSSGLGLVSKKKAKQAGEDSGSTWICSVELVSDVSLTGGTMVSVTAPTKRLAQLQCALLACERLDEACLLEISSLWNKRKNYVDNDFYEEDEDTFFDRTGQIEEQREKRKRRYEGDSAAESKAKTYSDLLKEKEEVESKLEVIKSEIERLSGKNKCPEGEEGGEKSVLNFSARMAISQMKGKEKKLLEERRRLTKLASIARPTHEFAAAATLKPPPAAVKMENPVEEKATEEMPKNNEEGEQKMAEDGNSKHDGNTSAEEKIGRPEENERSEEEEKRADEAGQPPQTATVKTEEEEPPTKMEEEAKEARFYAPAMPSGEDAAMIVPKFGILTKEELVKLKLMQRQREKQRGGEATDGTMGAAGKRNWMDEEEEGGNLDEYRRQKEAKTVYDSREKYATWLPPEDQSGDGSTRLNQKFGGKY